VRIFSHDEAEALLPAIGPLVAQLLEARRELAIGLLELEAAQTMREGAAQGPRTGLHVSHVRAAQMRIVDFVEKIQAHGCTVKDVDLGLIDFPALRDGLVVNLCWKMGESAIGFWHRMDEGFSARKPL
jgi:hypothetical protein